MSTGGGAAHRGGNHRPTSHPMAGGDPDGRNDMTLSAKQIETLGIFILDEDRSVPPYYAGRSEILADIEARVNLMWKRQEANGTRA